jgi:hypothetical protein
MSILSRSTTQIFFNEFALVLILRYAAHFIKCLIISEIQLWRWKTTSHVWLSRTLSINAQFARCNLASHSLSNELILTNINISRLIIFKIKIDFDDVDNSNYSNRWSSRALCKSIALRVRIAILTSFKLKLN